MIFSKPLRITSYFEEAVYRVFPMAPIPAVPENNKTDFNREARSLLNGRPWSEVIGRRLNFGSMDIHFTTWMSSLPLDVVKYYLPSHLILASIMLSYGAVSNYPFDLMEALILPPSKDMDLLADIEFELSLESLLTQDSESPIEFYKSMNPDQRSCIAYFLSLYGEYKKSEFTDRGFEFYTKNIEYWKNSTLII
ncbi:hypothetical protein ACO0LM_20130 [Undibacterium sp. Di26W]|uniref:hypothetical protein n=1 Tax=Undibacterium sp. Di26W TaxID=3413035 RepID=UPI003BF140AB